jgi:sugar phosphate isomerase/epimerase
MNIGVVTDEISRDIDEALRFATEWGIGLVELREGAKRRFPFFASHEITALDRALVAGTRVTAVSPGIFKQSAADESKTRSDLADTLPRTIELAARFSCPLVIVFGFEKVGVTTQRERVAVQRAFAEAAEQASAAGMLLAIENEPNFWIDGPEESVSIVNEIGHPGIRLNWDPANRIWGGSSVTRDDFDVLRPLIGNLHVKDFDPSDAAAPWVPVGSGTIEWAEILGWVASSGVLSHVTLETHCADGIESSRQSHERLTELLTEVSA